MEGGVFVRTPDGLLEGGEKVIVLIPVPVVFHGAPLRYLLGVRQRDPAMTSVIFVLDAAAHGGNGQHLHRVDRFSHVPAAAQGDVPGDTLLQVKGHIVFFRGGGKGALYRLFRRLRLYALEFEHS